MSLSQHRRKELLDLTTELASRKVEGVRLYKPNKNQEAFHASRASERLVLGGNRSGKSCCSFVELARAVTGQDPYDKYPKKNGVAMVVGKNWQHIGNVVYKYLFKAGAFQIIKDLQTGEWRAFDPSLDAGREDERKPSPPLIPPRLVSKMSWQMKAANYLNSCELTNGWTILCFSSEGEIPQGIAADCVVMDEELQSDAWVPEMQARLADKQGRLWVAAMPHSSSDWLLNLSERAEAEEKKKGPKNIEKFVLRFLDNDHIDADERTRMVERWSAQGADVLRQRAEGEFIFDSLMVYPSFAMHVHGYDRKDLPSLQVPPDWTRYIAVDPGFGVAAAVFMAVPPDESMWLVYDEVYHRQATAKSFAKEVALKLGTQQLQAMIGDGHGMRITDIGTGRQVGVQYTDAFREEDIRSVQTGNSFLLGCDNIPARVGATLSALMIRPSGTPKLRFLRDACPNLERELKKYRKKSAVVNGSRVITDVPNTKGECHAVQCVEYLVASEPRYVHRPEPPSVETVHPLVLAYEKAKKSRSSGSCVFEPAGASGGNINVGWQFHTP